MGQRRLNEDWERTSLVASILCNVNRGKDSEVLMFDHFNPYRKNNKKERKPEGTISGNGMIAIFCKQG